ncbi:MAG: putative toxin-antitoxin system toxin component, PIN family [archaeon]
MIRIVIDTNILISASFWKGNPYKLIELAIKKEIDVFTSIEILEEYAEVIKRDFKTSEEELIEKINWFMQILKLVEPQTIIQEIKEDPDDNKILEAAVEAKANYIISGDKHLLRLEEFKGIKIVKVKEFLENFF